LCEAFGVKFIDIQFLPTMSSLYIDLEDLPKKIIPMEWKRPEQVLTDYIVFRDQISPQDIQQGRLGNCWFMGALSIIAAKPELVLNMFVTKEKSPSGSYTIQFFRSEQWQQVTIDDYLPTLPSSGFVPYDINAFQQAVTALPGGYIYSRPVDGQLWVCLLEKASKMNQSYQSLTEHLENLLQI